MRTVLLVAGIAALLVAAVFVYLVALYGSVISAIVPDVYDPLDDADDEPLPGPPVAHVDPAPLAVVAVDHSGPRHDPVIGADQHTADRLARLAAFQRRETAERAARGFQSRGF